MIEIIPTKKLQRVLPLGLLNTKDPLLICTRDPNGRIAITEFTDYCNQIPPRTNQEQHTSPAPNKPSPSAGQGGSNHTRQDKRVVP